MDIETSNESSGNYVLRQTLSYHTKAARCVTTMDNYLLSGGLDNTVHLYIRSNPDSSYVLKHTYNFFNGFIYSIAFMDTCNEFVVGCQDKNVYVCSSDEPSFPTMTFEGHEGPVNCVKVRDF